MPSETMQCPTLQPRVAEWMMACFGPVISRDRIERNHRFIEEGLELVQACGCTADDAHRLVDYVYSRPAGERKQEVGGVMVTLAALCLAQGLDMDACAETELARIWTKVEQIRAKQAAKPKGSPLPLPPPPTRDGDKGGPAMGDAGTRKGKVEVGPLSVEQIGRIPVTCATGHAVLKMVDLDCIIATVASLTAERDAWKARAQAAEKVVADIASRSPGKGYRDVECSECWTLIEMAGDAVKSAAKEGRVRDGG